MYNENATDSAPMPTYFRFLALLAFKIFASEKVDVARLEVGLGGKFDATHVVQSPAVCGRTSLGYDHKEILGQIAGEQAAILKIERLAYEVGVRLRCNCFLVRIWGIGFLLRLRWTAIYAPHIGIRFWQPDLGSTHPICFFHTHQILCFPGRARFQHQVKPALKRWKELINYSTHILTDHQGLSNARLLEGDPLKIDQSALTGESMPVTKTPGDEVFSGSTCKQGEIEAVVIAIGVHTFFGKAAHLFYSTNQVGHFQKVLTVIENFCIGTIAIGMLAEVVVMYPIQRRKY